jgi:hypothetical protein
MYSGRRQWQAHVDQDSGSPNGRQESEKESNGPGTRVPMDPPPMTYILPLVPPLKLLEPPHNCTNHSMY